MKHIKNTVIPHGRHIFAKSSDMANAKMCAYPHSDHELPHWKCVMWCCDKCPSTNISDQETDDQYYNTSPSIRFHVYHLISRCTAHLRLPLNENKFCLQCRHDSASKKSTKIYTRKELVAMETTISNFHQSLYISAIQKLAFQITRVKILGTNHSGESHRTSFKRCE